MVTQILNTPLEMVSVAILSIIALVYAVRGLIHAFRMRTDAFELVGKVSKAGWVAILTVAGIVLLRNVLSMGSAFPTLTLVAWVVVGVYWCGKREEMNALIDGSSKYWH